MALFNAKHVVTPGFARPMHAGAIEGGGEPLSLEPRTECDQA